MIHVEYANKLHMTLFQQQEWCFPMHLDFQPRVYMKSCHFSMRRALHSILIKEWFMYAHWYGF